GVGGMNLTHSEPFSQFSSRYYERASVLQPLLAQFGAEQLRAWAATLGIDTFVGSSGRVFPVDMKAAPLLRAWLHRLRQHGVRFHVRHKWCGWDADNQLLFTSPAGQVAVKADAVVLALGGGSWARLGSDGQWVPLLHKRDVNIAPLKPANCGFNVAWTAFFRSKFAGQPVKSVAARVKSADSTPFLQGEFNISSDGIEGGLIYALSAQLRHQFELTEPVYLELDLMPGKNLEKLQQELAKPRGSKSVANHLRARTGIDGVKAGLLREFVPADVFNDPQHLSKMIKQLPIKLEGPRPLDEAISSAGGVAFEALDEFLMIRKWPGVFCAGEMLDWEAPTGGYLLTACFSTGVRAAHGVLRFLNAACADA
ncbi:MAG TPA: TIGR03862 family flavoprotein, partial [Pseudomonadales bacterium]|nr:TIGR03862 family flavoprotein [Pseudomonadales bacterium]